MFQLTITHGNQSMYTLWCDITCPSPCLHISCSYPKSVADLCLYQLQSTFNFKCMCMHTGIKVFLPRSYIANMYNKVTCTHSKHDDQEDIGICQFFTCQNFPNPGSSKFSTSKILHHTVANKSRRQITFQRMHTNKYIIQSNKSIRHNYISFQRMHANK